VIVHGLAGVVAVDAGRTITAVDVAAALPSAVMRTRGAV